MQVLILAAGYGTRLYPLTLNTPKPLLLCQGKPIIHYLLEKIKTVKSLKEIIVVTNAKFFSIFEEWARGISAFPIPVRIVSDGTTSPDDRLGAVGDINFTLKRNLINGDLLVLGGDNLFDYPLLDYVAFAQSKSPSVSIGLFDIKDQEMAKNFGVVELNAKKSIVTFEEKPKQPKSTLIAMCLYYLPKKSLSLITKYLQNSKSADTTGDYIKWLAGEQSTFGFEFQGRWYDIGSIEAYQDAEKNFKP